MRRLVGSDETPKHTSEQNITRVDVVWSKTPGESNCIILLCWYIYAVYDGIIVILTTVLFIRV